MVKVFIIIGLLLIFLGVPGLYWFSFQNDQMQQRIAFCKAKYSHQVDEYVHNLTGSSLSEADANGFDFTAAVNVEKMTPSQRLGYQQERLLADIDELAESVKTVPENADLLYGSGWRQKVADYKTKRQFLATVQVSSITAAIAGGVLFAAAFVFLAVRIFVGTVRWLIMLFNKKRTQTPVSPRPKPLPEEKFMPPAAVVSNTPKQTSKNPNPTAEEFRKLLVAQTESLKETVDQLRDLATVLQQRVAAENDQDALKRHGKGSKAQTDSFGHENDLLKKLVEDIRKAVEAQSKDLSKAVENSATTYVYAVKNEMDKSLEAVGAIQKEALALHADSLTSIKQQIDELSNTVHTSAASQKSGDEDICEKIGKLINSQSQSLKKEIEPLNEITGLINNKIEEIKDNRSAENSQAIRQYVDGLSEIKQQIAELTNAVHASASRDSGTDDICEKIGKLINSQSQSLKKEIEPLNEIADLINHKIEEIKNNRSPENSEAIRQYVDGLSGVKQQIVELTNAVHASASRDSGADDICEKIGKLINSQSQSIKKEIEPLNEIADLINHKIEEIKNNKSPENSEAIQQYIEGLSEIKQQIAELTNTVQVSALRDSGSVDMSDKIEKLLNDQKQTVTKEIEPLKQIADMLAQKCEEIKTSQPAGVADDQLRQETQMVRQISEESLHKGDAISKNIADLTEQVGAIREYAARQQQRLAKLQDGYDWNLIKNFCMRVIRCIDNLDDRIAELTESGDNAGHLLAVREELAFVLESNGVEPFGAKIDSDYRGQENCLQVLNERDETDDTNLVGKIAQVVRPGYQSRVNDEYTKIVRPAHVRLYGSTCLSNVAVRGE